MHGLFELEDQVAGVRGHQGIDHRGGLVVQNRLRILCQSAGDGHGAFHARAELIGQFIEELADFQHLGQLGHARVDCFRREVRALVERKLDVFAHRERIEKRAGLKDHGYAPANLHQLPLGPIGDVLAGHDHASRIRLQESEDVLQRDGFAYAAAPHDHAGLAGINRKADVIEHHMIVEGFADFAELDVVIHCAVLPAAKLILRRKLET